MGQALCLVSARTQYGNLTSASPVSPTASTRPIASVTLPSLTSSSTCSPISVPRTSQIVLPSCERVRSVGVDTRSSLEVFMPPLEVVPTLSAAMESEPVVGAGKVIVSRNVSVGAR